MKFRRDVDHDLWVEFKFVVLSEPIDFKYWSNKLGIPRNSFRKYLNSRGITHTSSKFGGLSIKDKDQLVKDYINGISANDLVVKYHTHINNVRQYIIEAGVGYRGKGWYSFAAKIEKNIPIENTGYAKAFNLAKFLGLQPELGISKSKKPLLTIKCTKCDSPIKLAPYRFMKTITNADKCVCRDCYIKEFRETYHIKKKRGKNNTSGFLGISVYSKYLVNRGYIPRGYVARFRMDNEYVVDKKFLDPTLSTKTLYEAAIFREQYLIDNNLNYARNFTDEEFISALEFVGQKLQNTESTEQVKSCDITEFDKYFV